MSTESRNRPEIAGTFTHKRGIAKNGLAGVGVGFALATGLSLSIFFPWLAPFTLYILFVSFFHLMEFVLVALYHPETLSFDSWLLNHSSAFHMAMAACVVEYWIEYFVFDVAWGIPFKLSCWVTALGVAMVVGGQALRSTAMFQAGQNFTHLVADRKETAHQLVQTGVYSVFRHPAYTGWFWWCVGCQLILVNPVCTVGWAIAAWKFFSDRIPGEEEALVADDFFGDQYRVYHAKTIIGIPFLSTTLPVKRKLT